jgi:hypothetical protein
MSELHGRGADAAADAVDQDALARSQGRLNEHGVVRRHEDFGDAAGFDEVERVRHARAQGRAREDVGGVASASQDPEHSITLAEAGHVRSRRGDGTGELEPGNVTGRVGWSRVAADPLKQVGAVDPGAGDLHEHLVHDRLGSVPFDELEPPVRYREGPQRPSPASVPSLPSHADPFA